MTYTGDIQFTIVDGQAGIFSGPSNSVQAVIGTAASGTVNTVVPTRSLSTLSTTFTSGPMVEAAGLVLQAGGTVLAVRATTATAGSIDGSAQATTNISAVSIVATNARITYSAQTPHVLQSGDVVTIASVGGATEVNGTWVITVIDATHFEVPVTSITAYTSGGTVQFTGAVTTGGSSGAVGSFAGTAAPYFTGTPDDDAYVMVVAQTGFTVGTTGGTVICSLDAGRNFGPPIAVGTNTTLLLKDVGGRDTGLTLHLGTSGKTWTGGGVSNGIPIGDAVRCHAIAPQPNDSGISAALGAIVTYLSGSETSFPLVQVVMNAAASDATAVESSGTYNLDNLATNNYLFVRAIMSARDAKAPAAWGGAGESESTWSAAVIADFSATTAKRVCMSAGHYNMPSAFPTIFASTPSYRRPFSFALAARQVSIQPQTHAGRAGGTFGGALTQIVRNSVRDVSDGFVYHDELVNPVFDYFLPGGVGRLASARSRARKAGLFAADPLMLGAVGSDFTLLPRAIVMDVACTITHDVLENFMDADLTTNANGTLSDSAAATVRGDISDALTAFLQAVGMISGFTVVVDQTQNILVTNKLVVTISILGVAYVLEGDVSIGYVNQLAAQPAA